MRTLWLPVSVGLAAVLTTALAVAQTTGTIEGTVVDERGQVLPGVTVEATSAALQASKVATSDESGGFHLVFLPPGAYAVRCTLAGFSDVEQGEVLVGLGRTVTLHVQMRSAFKEEITVSGATPAVDVSSAEVGANVGSQFFQQLPLARNYAAAMLVTPGTAEDGSGTMVYGSSGAENAFYIDGVNTTGINKGQQGKELNSEFIQEVQVKTGGYQAEFGRSTGGLVNVITKAGGNEFHGDGFGYYFSDALQSSPKQEVEVYKAENVGSYVEEAFRRADFGADLGGYVLKDKLWFFAAYDRVNNDTDQRVSKNFTPYGGPPEGKVYVASQTRDLWAAKLTWRLSPNHSLIASAFGDPTTDEGPLPNRGLNGPETGFLGTQESGGSDGMVKYEGILGSSLIIDAQASRHREKQWTGGPGIDLVRTRDYTTALYAQTGTNTFTGGLGYYTSRRYERDVYRANLTYFLGHAAGDHEIKAGVEYEHVPVDVFNAWSGGQSVGKDCATGHLTENGCGPEWVYYRHGVLLTALPPDGFYDPNLMDYVVGTLETQLKSDNRAAYLQDTWHVLPALTINLGLRWEAQQLYDPSGEVRADMTGSWAPRLGFTWDWRGDGSSKLYGSWGRFYETIPMDLAIRGFNYMGGAALINRDPTAIFCDPSLDADPDAYGGCWIGGPYWEKVDPDLKGQYMDEAILGAEVAAGKDWTVGAKAIWRNLGRVVEDGQSSEGEYYIGNPSQGLLRYAYDQTYTWTLPVPPPRRTFTGIELVARKRFADNWQLLASYLYSRLEGNYDGNFQASTGQLDPNINSAYDYAEFEVNTRGWLTNDRRHQFRLDGTYRFPFGLDLGLSAFYRTGIPVTAMGYDYWYGNWELYLSERGMWDRTDSEYEMSLHLGYPLKLGGVQVNLLLDVFNLINRQGETARDTRYDLRQVLDVIDYETGKALPPIKNGTPCTSLVSAEDAFSCNSVFNKANAWQDPRSVRLGVRVTF